MARIHANWIEAFMEQCRWMESPRHMHFWTAVSTIAGALRRKVWFQEAYYTWYPNFFILFVAPPGVVAKSTTSSVGMKLLRQVPDITFGPDVATMPALSVALSKCGQGFEINGMIHQMAAITLEASEFGNLFDPNDQAMTNFLIDMWDGKASFRKETKTAGVEEFINPWVNIIACTTPAWIAQNFPEVAIGGGFTSRCVFVYADKKSQLVAYPSRRIPKDFAERQRSLIADLTHISQNVAGEYTLTDEAYEWGEAWYSDHNLSNRHIHLDKDRFGGYLSRKQAHVHKLAMVLAAAQSDDLVITLEHLQTADIMVTDLEPDMAMVFSKIGKSEDTVYIEKLIEMVHAAGSMPYMAAYRLVHMYFPSLRSFEDVVLGAVRAGYLALSGQGDHAVLKKGSADLPRSLSQPKPSGKQFGRPLKESPELLVPKT